MVKHSLPEHQVARNIARFLQLVPAQRRGEVLRRVFLLLEYPKTSAIKAPILRTIEEEPVGTCPQCGKEFKRRASNHRFDTARCAKAAERQQRLALSGERAMRRYG